MEGDWEGDWEGEGSKNIETSFKCSVYITNYIYTIYGITETFYIIKQVATTSIPYVASNINILTDMAKVVYIYHILLFLVTF